MQINIQIVSVQHIKKLTFSIDLAENKLMCIVGKNGVGKTTLIRAIKNIQSADTFKKTASPYIFNKHSQINYTINGEIYSFLYHPKLKVIDSKDIVPINVKNNIFVELPMPHGNRFIHFQKLGEIDSELRKSIPLEEYREPTELITFLSNIYNSSKFSQLKEVSIKGRKYYFILQESDFYIREDYLSSGEYFVINLYKLIQSKCKCIVIDEIDISLDSSAQVNLLNQLRILCQQYEITIIFTTHSLALMKKLSDTELYYMEKEDGVVTISNKSYNYVKSMLFGFKGWDKYILTEDDVLKRFIEYLIQEYCTHIFHKYIILYIGGSSNVADLVKRNKHDNFFSTDDNIMIIYDGDQLNEAHVTHIDNAECIPFESLEKDLYKSYLATPSDFPEIDDLQNRLDKIKKESKKGKQLFTSLIKTKSWSEHEIFDYLIAKEPKNIKLFSSKINKFLSLAE